MARPGIYRVAVALSALATVNDLSQRRAVRKPEPSFRCCPRRNMSAQTTDFLAVAATLLANRSRVGDRELDSRVDEGL